MDIGSPLWVETVARLFGVAASDVVVSEEELTVAGHSYRIHDGVVILDGAPVRQETSWGTADDVRRSFSAEWETYAELQPEHQQEFDAYFDVVDLDSLADDVAIDLGCGSGRWSHFLAPHCRAVVLVDFSDAIFVARRNLAGADNAIFFRGDVTDLPFVDQSADFVFSLGVLHHLDRPCLPVARDLMRLGPMGLFYLYYALDNRPWYFTPTLRTVTAVRKGLSHVESEKARRRTSRAIAWGVYRPMVGLGYAAERLSLPVQVPLYESYRGKSIERIEQDAYDRFFTTIEQRVSKAEIADTFQGNYEVVFSDQEPYWHFRVDRMVS